jgi:hypothetical protein
MPSTAVMNSGAAVDLALLGLVAERPRLAIGGPEDYPQDLIPEPHRPAPLVRLVHKTPPTPRGER